MKSPSFLCLLLLSCCLLSCDEKDAYPSDAAPETEKRVEKIPLRFQSREILPGSKKEYSSSGEKNDMPYSIAHDLPSMEKEARTVYSYMGAARVFKSICGIDLPEWVEPMKGGGYVTMRKSGPVRHSTVEYKIDPARRAELEKLIVDGRARSNPKQRPVVFYTPSSPPSKAGSRVGGLPIRPDGKVKESMAVRLEEDGTVVLMASRGPVGWDD